MSKSALTSFGIGLARGLRSPSAGSFATASDALTLQDSPAWQAGPTGASVTFP
jgi:hypothetical protein